jgi:hypothetical protein
MNIPEFGSKAEIHPCTAAVKKESCDRVLRGMVL